MLYLSGEDNFHLGYALMPNAWGKGFATELVKAGAPYFFEQTGKHELFAITSSGNTASQQVLLKSGFHRKGDVIQSGETLDLFVANGESVAIYGK